MPSCAARCAVAADERAESMPTFNPARCAHTRPVPSLMSNCLLSEPSGCMRILPSVSTPSTSKSRSFTRAAFAWMDISLHFCLLTFDFSLLTFNFLDHLRAPQIVQVEDAADALVRS